MPKTLGLTIKIGAIAGAAIKTIDLVTGSTKILGTAIDKLNSKKIKLLEGIDKEFKTQLEPIENELKKFYDKQKDIKLKIRVKNDELKEFEKKIKDTEKEIKKLEKEKIDLEKQFKKGKISATEFESKTKEIEKDLTKLKNKKIGLDSKFQLINKKANLLKGSLDSVNRKIDKLKNKKLKLSDELEKAKQKTIEANRELKKLGSAIESINKRKIKIQANLDKRADLRSRFWDTVAIGGTLAMPFKAGINFESEMARVKALSGATKKEFEKLKETAKQLGSTTVFSASEAAKGMQYLAMAGYKTNDIVKAMPGILDLAASGQIDLARASDIASNILSGFGLKAKETTHVADVLAKAATSTNVSIAELGETMKYVAPVASNLGASVEEVTALTGLLGNVGIKGTQAGTALRAMYARLAAPPSEALKTMKALGLVVKDANGKFVGMTNVLKQLQEKTKGMSDTQKAAILKNLFGIESMSAAMALLKTPIKNVEELTQKLKKADGWAKKVAEEQTDTVAGSFKAFGSAVEGLSISFSNLFLPTIKLVTEGITWFARKVDAFINEHKTLATVIGGGIAGFMALTVVSFGMGYAFTFIANAWHKTFLAYTLLTNATTLFTNAEKRAVFWTNVLNKKAKILTFTKKAWAFATRALSKSIKFLGTALKFAGKGALWFLTTLKKGIVLGYNTALKVLSWSAARAKLTFNLFGKSLLFVGSKLKTAGIYAYNLALKTLNITASLTTNALKFAGRSLLWLGRVFLLNHIGLAITAIAAGAYFIYKNWDTLKSFFSKLWEGIKSIFKIAWSNIKDTLSWTPLGLIINNWSTIKSWFGQFWSWLKERFSAGVTFIKNLFTNPVQTISAVWSNLANWFSGFWSNLTSGFSKGVSVITNIFLHPINTIQAMWNKLLGWIMSKIKWLSDTIGKVKGWFSSLFGGDEEKERKLTLKPVTEKVKPIVTAAAVTTTIATAQPATIKPVKPVSVPVNVAQVQSAKNAQSGPSTIVYNFNFGDIVVETKDGKIANPEELKEQLKQIIEDINFEHKQRSLSDVV